MIVIIICAALPASMFGQEGGEWNNLFAADLSDAIYPEGIWTFDEGILLDVDTLEDLKQLTERNE